MLSQTLYTPESNNMNDELLEAIKCSNCSKISSLLDKKIMDVNTRYKHYGKRTPLHFAAQLGNRDVILLLLAKGTNVQATTERGFNALHVAAQFGHAGILHDLVTAGIEINSVMLQRETALHMAASKGHETVVDELLKLNADPTIQESKYFLTAANLAYINNHSSICKRICSKLDYEQLFIQNVSVILFSPLSVLPVFGAQDVRTFLEKLRGSISTLKKADDVFIAIKSAFESNDYKKVSGPLKLTRKLVIDAMKKYNADKVTSNSSTPEAPAVTVISTDKATTPDSSSASTSSDQTRRNKP